MKPSGLSRVLWKVLGASAEFAVDGRTGRFLGGCARAERLGERPARDDFAAVRAFHLVTLHVGCPFSINTALCAAWPLAVPPHEHSILKYGLMSSWWLHLPIIAGCNFLPLRPILTAPRFTVIHSICPPFTMKPY